MTSVIASIILETATRIGAPLVRELLSKHLGTSVGRIGESIIETVAEEAGVSVDGIPSLPANELEAAVRAAERRTPELVAAWVEQQRETNRLFSAEMQKSESWWTWAWRPAWMWFLGFLFLFRLVLVPIADAVTGADIAESVDLGTMMTLTAWFMALYMGGHTVKETFSNWPAKR